MPAIGFLSPTSSEMFEARLRAFRQGLKENGYFEGQNVAIVYRWADGQFDRLPELAAELVHLQVAVIVTAGGPPSTLAAKAATTTIPIVFNAAEDPVRLGFVDSLARPGGNLTGVNFFIAELTAKRMELLRELVPRAKRVAVLTNPAQSLNSETTVREVEAAARATGLQIQIFNATTSREIDAAFASLVSATTRRSPRERRATERGLNVYRAVESLARARSWPLNWRLIELPGVGHSAKKMFASTSVYAGVAKIAKPTVETSG